MNNVTDEMVNRFLGWKLPEDFAPDCGITFKPMRNEHMPWGGDKNEPVGTNLLTAHQARAMLEHVVGAAAPAAPAYVPLSDGDIHAIYDKVARLEPYSGAVTRRNVARAIEALVVARMRGEGK